MKKNVMLPDFTVLRNQDSILVYLYIELLKQPKFDVILDPDQIIEDLSLDYTRFNKAISELVMNDMAIYDTKRRKYDTISTPSVIETVNLTQ